MVARVARAVHARRAVQRVHAQAAVVRQRGQARGPGDGLGLDDGVLLKGSAVFLDIALKARVLHADELHHAAEDVAQLLELVRVAAGHHHAARGQEPFAHAAQRLALGVHHGAHARAAQVQKPVQLPVGKGPSLARALQFDELAPLVHHQVHVRLGAAVLLIAQVQHGPPVHHASADGRHLRDDGVFVNQPVLHELVNRHHQRHIRAGDGGRARAAVGLQNVAVQRDGALAQKAHVHRLAKRTADQPLNLDAPAVPFDAVARLAPARGCGQHGVLGRHPAAALATQEGRHALLHAGGADDAGLARGNQTASVRRLHKIGDQSQWAGLRVPAAVHALHAGRSFVSHLKSRAG